MEGYIDVDAIDFSATLEEMKLYQRRHITELRKLMGPEEAALALLGASGAYDIKKFGGRPSSEGQSYLQSLKVQIRKRICPKKGNAGSAIINTAPVKIASLAVLTNWAVSLSAPMGLPVSVIVPLLYFMLEKIAEVGVDAWCDCSS